MATTFEYSNQARTYDSTRAASPSVLEPLVAALARTPERVLDPAIRRQTSFFEWAEREAPTETERGLQHLARDLEAGRRPEERHRAERAEIGDAFVLAWTAPAA